MKNIFIILNYNDSATTISYLKNIKKFKNVDNIIVIDNCSTDNSLNDLYKVKSNKVEILKTNQNKGYAYGNNYGIKYAIKKYHNCNLIISNPDIIIDEITFNSLINKISNDSDISLIAPTIKENGVLNRGWKLPTAFNELMLSIPHFATKYKDNHILYKEDYYKNDISKVDVVSGCFFIIKSEVITKINYFDENTFLYYEENILAQKLKEKGYKTYISNKDYIIHNHSISINKSVNELKKFKLLKQSQEYYLKNYCHSNIFINILIKIFEKIIILNIKLKFK
jgi:N-acetylglucosaminyl-diphospho-decaprenol L-rhamnosyltransferase